MRSRTLLWFVLLCVLGCHHEDARNNTQTQTAAVELKVSPQTDPRLDPVVLEMVNSTGVQLYPGTLIDRSKQPENRLSGTQHLYTVAMLAKDSLKTVAAFYESQLGARYLGSVSSGRIDGASPNNSSVSITFQQRSNCTAYVIDATTPRPQAGLQQTMMGQPVQKPAPQPMPQDAPQPPQQPQTQQQFTVNTNEPPPQPVTVEPSQGG